MKQWKLWPVFLLLVVLLGALAVPAGAVSGSDLCYKYTPQMTDNTFRYLDEIYIQKYPEMGLRWTQGTEKDKQVLQRLADIITQDCTTDEQKAEAIAGWISRNVEYDERYRPFYAVDVFYARKANCAGYAQMMQTLLRLEGIPAVWGDGFAMDTQVITVEQMQSLWAGHAWCFAYVDGQWKMYDPLWEGTRGLTDRDYIAKNYFLDTVDQIIPAYDSGSLPPFRDPDNAQLYVDGRFVYYRDGKQLSTPGQSGCGVTINLVGNFDFTICTYELGDPAGEEGFRYLDYPERYPNMVRGELFRDGWVQYGSLILTYHYENGVAAHGIVMERDGDRYFMNFRGSHRLFLNEDQYFIEDGYLSVTPGLSGKLFEPYWYPQYKDDPEYEITWTCEDPDIATVDQNGMITSTGKEGVAEFWIQLKWKGGSGIQARESLSISFETDDRVADFNDYQPHECSYQIQVVPPTCVSGGYTVHTCSCGNSYQDNETEALGHTYGPWQIVQEATQEQDGIQMRKCIRCDNEETSFISYVPPEHICVYEVVQVVEPDCEHEGYTVSVCSCGRTRYSDQTSALGGHRFGPWEVAEPPTAEHDGLQIRECTQCGQLEAEPIPAGTELPPQPTEPIQGGDHTCQWVAVEVVPAWCDEEGYTVYACSLCGIEKVDDFTPAGHRYGPWEVWQEPDEYNSGFRIRYCEMCGIDQGQEIPAGSGGQMPPDPTDPPQPTHPVTPDPAPTRPAGPGDIWLDAEGDSNISVLFPGADPEQLAGVTVQAEEVQMDPEVVMQLKGFLENNTAPVAQLQLVDITLMAGGQIIQPDGIVVVQMPLPDPSWASNQLAAYHIGENGELNPLQVDLSEDGQSALFVVEHFSYYALVLHGNGEGAFDPSDPGAAVDPENPMVPGTPSTPGASGNPETDILPWVLVAVLLVVIIVGTVVVIILFKKRK